MRRPLRHTAAAAVLALLVTGLSACNDDSSGDSGGSGDRVDKQAESSATASAEESGSSSVAPSAGEALSKAEITDVLEASASAFTSARVRMSMAVEANGQEIAMDAHGLVQARPLEEELTAETGGTTMQMRLVDDVLYLKAPMLSRDDQWLRVPLADLDKLGLGSIDDALSNPAAMMDQTTRFITRAMYVGEEEVGGHATRHYRTTLDADGLAKQMKLPSGVQVPASATQDFWIDEDDQVVKIVQDMEPLQTMTLTMSDFGTKVDVTAPPASQVTDLPRGIGG